MLATLVARGCHFVMRLPPQSFTAVNAFWAPRAQERGVTLAVTAKARPSVAEPHLPTTLRGRLRKVRLPKGEGEGLGTDLLDAQLYPPAAFKVGDGWRWTQET